MYQSSTPKSVNLLAPLIVILYLSIGFVPNWGAVDRIAPQWLIMSILNLFCFIFFVKQEKNLSGLITASTKSSLTLIYLTFILWALGSIIYAINSTETLVNLARQINVFFMFFSLVIFISHLRNKLAFISWVFTIILIIEVYAVIVDAFEIYNLTGKIIGGNLKGVTANRNITAFSIAIKIPFVLFLIHLRRKLMINIIVYTLITASFVCLSIIESRASFIAVGLILVFYIGLSLYSNFVKKDKLIPITNISFLIAPLFFSIMINQVFLSTKGVDVISRASTISVSTKDNSINQRLRYYEDVVKHISSNPVLGVGLGNWKLKSIDYDSKDINGYVVPYHAHSDFIQLGAELGLIGFLLYLGIFLCTVIYGVKLFSNSKLKAYDKVFLFLAIISLGVYSIDANLNFPIARPQALVVWTLIIALINSYYVFEQNNSNKIVPNRQLNFGFIGITFLLIAPSIFINNSVYNSLKGQMILLQDFNSNQFNLPLNMVETVVPSIPNITVTTIPINSVKARYFVNAKQYDKALALLDKGTKANPYLYYSEILKSQIFQEKGQLDSALVYAKKAFFGLPNNDLHAARLINLINLKRDRESLEEAFELFTYKNKENNWKNYLIVASGLYPPKDNLLMQRAKKAMELFPSNPEIQGLYRQIAVGAKGVNLAGQYSAKGLEYFNKQDYKNAAQQFEKAIEANPLDYAHFENAATANYMIGDLQKAEDQIDVVINDLNPLNGKCEYIKALIFIKMGDPVGACPLLATARDSGFSQAAGTFDQYCR